jgi:hypothetical protein
MSNEELIARTTSGDFVTASDWAEHARELTEALRILEWRPTEPKAPLVDSAEVDRRLKVNEAEVLVCLRVADRLGGMRREELQEANRLRKQNESIRETARRHGWLDEALDAEDLPVPPPVQVCPDCGDDPHECGCDERLANEAMGKPEQS